jgi:uncharacterized protein GlcG (DUF336 family)
MARLSFARAQRILRATLSEAEARSLNPLAVVVLDDRGVVRSAASQDGVSLGRFEIAHGKAYGALAAGVGSRTLNRMALDRPHFISALVASTQGRCVPVPGGVLMRDARGEVVGAVGVSGDTSDNDEAAAMGGIESAGLSADGGAA